MARNLSIAGSIAVLALIGAYLMSQSDTPSPPATTPVRSAEQPATPDVDVSQLDLDQTLDLSAAQVVETEASTIDLALGQAGISGTVRRPEGQVTEGARVTLYRAKLAEITAQGGLSSPEMIDRDWWRGRGRRSTPAGNRRGLALRPELLTALEPVARVRSDADGRYAFTGIATGEYLIAGIDNGTLNTPAAHVSYLADSQQSVEVYLVEAARLEGRVLDPNMTGVSGAEVAVTGQLLDFESVRRGGTFFTFEEVVILLLNSFDQVGKTDGDGQFSFYRLPMLTYDIRVVAPPWAESDLRLEVPHNDEVEIVLAEGARITGRVIDSKGNGIAAAQLTAEATGGDWQDRMRNFGRRRFVESAADGTFAIEGLAPGDYRIRAEREGFIDTAAEDVVADIGADAEVEIKMTVGAVLAGVVVDENDAAVVDASVRVTLVETSSADATNGDTGGRRGRQFGNRGGRGGRRGRGGFGGFGGIENTRTDQQGRFRFTTLEAGHYEIVVDATGLVTNEEHEADTGTTDIEVTMVLGHELVGHIVDTEGKAIEGASIRVGRGRGGNGRAESAADGAFRLAGIADPVVSASVQKRGYLTLRYDDLETGDVGSLEMQPAPKVSGIVLAPDRAPISGVRVTARETTGNGQQGGRRRRGGFGRGGRGRGPSAWTNSNGEFTLEFDRADGEWELVASARGYLDGTYPGVVLDQAPITGTEIVLGRAGELFGRVVATNGQPVAEARLSLVEMQDPAQDNGARGRGGNRPGQRGRRRGFGRGFRAGASSNIDGDYQIVGIQPGRYELRVQAKGHAAGRFTDIEVSEGGAQRFDVSLEPERVLFGFVGDVYGNPIAGASVGVRGELNGYKRATTKEDGRFEVAGLANELLSLDVRKRDYARYQARDIEANGLEQRIVLEQSYAASGVVIDAETGQPVSGARIRFSIDGDRELPTGARSSQSDRTDRDGRFEVRGLVAGNWSYRVDTREYLPFESAGLVVPGARAEAMQIALASGGRIRGRVKSADGRPIEGAVISARAAGAMPAAAPADGQQGRRRQRGQRRSDRSDADGLFDVRGLADGTYTVTVTHDDFITQTIEAQEVAQGDGSRELVFELEPGAVVYGTVLESSGARMTSGRVTVRADGVSKSTSIGDDGTYRIGGLAKGEYTIAISQGRRGPSLYEESIQLRDRQELRKELRVHD